MKKRTLIQTTIPEKVSFKISIYNIIFYTFELVQLLTRIGLTYELVVMIG